MNLTINPYLISDVPRLSRNNFDGLGAIAKQLPTQRDEDHLFSILMKEGIEPNTIPINTQYGQLLTSMNNLVEAIKSIGTDISDLVPYRYLFELATKAGITIPISQQLVIKQKIAEGKGNLSHHDEFMPYPTVDLSKMVSHFNNGVLTFTEPEAEQEPETDDQSSSLTASLPSNSGLSTSTKVALGLTGLAIIGGILYLKANPRKLLKRSRAEKASTK